MIIQAVLWDFGDTLADERWMLAPLPGAPDWPTVYQQILDGDDLADRWNLGQATTVEIAEELAAALGVSPDSIERHMQFCCRNITFYPAVMALAAKLACPQAIVTINPDIFSTVVVPTYRFHERFASIVTSWQERTLSKADLCDIAMTRLTGATDREACLLIDNKLDNVLEWRARGGRAWHFQDAGSLAEHVLGLT